MTQLLPKHGKLVKLMRRLSDTTLPESYRTYNCDRARTADVSLIAGSGPNIAMHLSRRLLVFAMERLLPRLDDRTLDCPIT